MKSKKTNNDVVLDILPWVMLYACVLYGLAGYFF